MRLRGRRSPVPARLRLPPCRPAPNVG